MCLQAYSVNHLAAPDIMQAQRRVRGLQQSFTVNLKQGESAWKVACCDQRCCAMVCCLRLMHNAL